MTISTVRKFGVGVASIAMVAGMAAPALAADPVDNRLAGADRYDTAIQIAEDSTEFSNPAVVYVSRGDVLVDAVTAGSLKGGPMLLVNDDKDVQDKVAEAIRKLGVSKIVVIGGEKAVSKETLAKIAPAGVATERIAGKDRYETAVKIAEKMIQPNQTILAADKTVYLANGVTLVDALAGGQLTDGPILLTDGSGKLPAATANALNTKFYKNDVVALGGTKAVTDAELNAANVAKVIIPDTFIQDYQKEIKAAAVAGLKVHGYYTVSSKVNKAKFIKAAAGTDKLKAAKIESTWPKVDATMLPGSGDWYVPTKADDGSIDDSVAQPASKANAHPYKAEKLDDGTMAANYAGTNQAYDGLFATYNTANTAKATIATNAVTTSGGWGADTKVLGKDSNLVSTTLDANTKSQQDLYDALHAVFGDLKDGNTTLGKNAQTTVAQLVKAVIPTSVYDANVTSTGTFKVNSGDSGAAAALNVVNALKSAVAVKVASLQGEMNTAAAANVAAKKVLKTASDTLDERSNRRIPSDSLQRIAGNDRYSTSVAIAKAVFGDKGEDGAPTRLYFADGTAFADAAVSGMLTKGPVLLVGKDMVPGSVNDYAKGLTAAVTMSRKNIIALGGTAVIADKNLTDELNVLVPITASKDYTAAFGPNIGNATLATGGYVSNGQYVKFATEVKNVPNGGNVKYVWQVNTGDGWNDYSAENIASLHGTNSYGVTGITFPEDSTGHKAVIAVGGSSGTATNFSLRLAVKVVNANGDELVATQYSTPVELKTQVG